jgi:flagellar biosynthetic protein FlhB
MAEEVDEESKTEDPTPRRREEARRQGRVPFSAEAVGSLVLLAGTVALANFGADLWDAMRAVFTHDLARLSHPDLDALGARELIQRAALRMLAALAPLLGLLLAVGVAASVVQVGFQINTEKLEPDFDKLNPATGAMKLFSGQAAVKAVLMLLKVAALGVVAYLVLDGRAGVVVALGRGDVGWAAAASWSLVLRLATYMVAAVALVAVLDYLYQRHRFEVALRMTRQELKDEMKQEEGDPEIKARIRQLQRERSRRKMMREVPKATVVVTNPTHYAVALRYDPPRDESPVVVARGAGTFAKRVAAVARENRVPVLERPALARALYGVREGRAIPGPLFRAVAEVLAFVYRLRGYGPAGAALPGNPPV